MAAQLVKRRLETGNPGKQPGLHAYSLTEFALKCALRTVGFAVEFCQRYITAGMYDLI